LKIDPLTIDVLLEQYMFKTVAKVRSKNYNDVDVKIKVRIKVLKKSSPINH
jgi:hypothetical protein